MANMFKMAFSDRIWAKMVFGFLTLGCLLGVQPALGQQQDTLVIKLPALEVEALRSSVTESSSPFAVFRLDRSASDVALQPGLSLQHALRRLPGLTLNDRGHFALGERLLIRGMGWRSAFGVRGVQVLLDGIPLTLPDGQGMLDIVDPAFIRRVELVRGPSSTFWGNGSGGVLMMSTDAFSDTFGLGVRVMGGSYGLRNVSANVAIPIGNHRISGYVSSVQRDGYRDYSSGSFTRGAFTGQFDLGNYTQLRVVSGFAVQDTESPGALTAEQLEADPRGADLRNVNALAGKESNQFQVGATVYRELSRGMLSVTAFGLMRQLDNPLSYTYIELDRQAGGARIQFQSAGERARFGVGVDAGFQSDDRVNRTNNAGKPGAEVALDQQEDVSNLSAFVTGQYDVSENFVLSAGVRVDQIDFSLEDRLPGSVDISGDRSFSAVSPSFGVTYRIGNGQLFANFSTAFETPTTTELVNQPSGSAGLNASVGPQKTKGVEVGGRGRVGRSTLDVAFFQMFVSEQLQPFQDSEGRTYYVNAGQNKHTGVELAMLTRLSNRTQLATTYALSQFQFDSGALENNRLPGIPVHHLVLGLQTNLLGVKADLDADFISLTYADDDNTAENAGHVVLDFGIGHQGIPLGGALIQPFGRVSNLLDSEYAGSMVINAFGGRFFEPAAGRTIQLGLGVTF